MGAAPYQVDVTSSLDGTIEFSCEWLMEDGSDWPWSDYAISYAVHDDCGGCLCSCDYEFPGAASPIVLTQGAGIVVDPDQNLLTITIASIHPGRHRHACRAKHLASGKIVVIFDGTLTILKGAF